MCWRDLTVDRTRRSRKGDFTGQGSEPVTLIKIGVRLSVSKTHGRKYSDLNLGKSNLLRVIIADVRLTRYNFTMGF